MKNLGLLSMACGALVGATAAILLAPKSGSQTRSDIKHALDEKIKMAKLKGEHIHQEVQRKLEDTIGEKNQA